MNKKQNKKQKIKYPPFTGMRRKMMRDSKFRRAYENIQPKYEVIRAILDARVKHGITQAQLAKRAGTTQSAIARFESGATNPTFDFLVKISKALDKHLEVKIR